MKGRFTLLKLVRKILPKTPPQSGRSSNFSPAADDDWMERKKAKDTPPEDVKEGHFVVYTIDDGEEKRFIIELTYLSHPGFLQLLEQAEEEFGFGQEGVLAIPCRHHDLERILEDRENRECP